MGNGGVRCVMCGGWLGGGGRGERGGRRTWSSSPTGKLYPRSFSICMIVLRMLNSVHACSSCVSREFTIGRLVTSLPSFPPWLPPGTSQPHICRLRHTHPRTEPCLQRCRCLRCWGRAAIARGACKAAPRPGFFRGTGSVWQPCACAITGACSCALDAMHRRRQSPSGPRRAE